VIPALVQEVLVALIVAVSMFALVSRFVLHRRVRRCPSCGPTPTTGRTVGARGIRAKGLDVLS
jgi:hypothetical protein